jgi:hypothetical protein
MPEQQINGFDAALAGLSEPLFPPLRMHSVMLHVDKQNRAMLNLPDPVTLLGVHYQLADVQLQAAPTATPKLVVSHPSESEPGKVWRHMFILVKNQEPVQMKARLTPVGFLSLFGRPDTEFGVFEVELSPEDRVPSAHALAMMEYYRMPMMSGVRKIEWDQLEDSDRADLIKRAEDVLVPKCLEIAKQRWRAS